MTNDVQHKRNLLLFIVLSILLLAAYMYSSAIKGTAENIRSIDVADTLITITALLLLFIQPLGGFPQPLDRSISNRERWLIPLAAGTFFGLLDLLTVKVIQHPQPYDSLPPFLQPFPYSLFLYSNGALYVETLFRLIPFMVIMVPITRFTPKQYHEPLFVIIAIASSLYEPLDQFPSSSPAWFKVYAFTSGFLMNYLQASFFRSYGFIASLAVRLGHYLIWHVLLGIYVQFIELAK